MQEGGLHPALSVDATEHYRQKAERLKQNEALLAGTIMGIAFTFVALLAWQRLGRA